MKTNISPKYSVIGLLLVLVLMNVNCSRVVFSGTESQNPLDQSLEPTDTIGSAGPVSASPAPTPTVDPGPNIPPFECKQFVVLAQSNDLQIPPRDAAGTCYSIKLLDAIANSSSQLATELDMEVVSRDHDTDQSNVRNPYVLGEALVNLTLADRRFVKLSGAKDSLSPIKVDNFIVTGIYPKQALGTLPETDLYKAYGTADSKVPGEDGVLLRNTLLPLVPFGLSGTSTLSALDITTNIVLNTPYTLELRALDCGGQRELSDVYLLFQ